MVKLTSGVGSPDQGGCWMVACNIYSHAARVGWQEAIAKHWNDSPDDVCPVIRQLAIVINDALPDDATRERVLGPWLCAPSGTRDDALLERRRWYVVDHAVRVWAPLALEAGRLDEHAAKLRALRPVTRETADAARDAARDAADAAYAAASATAATANAASYAASYAAYAADAAYAAARAAYTAKTDTIERYVLPVLLEMCSWSSLPEADAERRAETERVLEQARVGQEGK